MRFAFWTVISEHYLFVFLNSYFSMELSKTITEVRIGVVDLLVLYMLSRGVTRHSEIRDALNLGKSNLTMILQKLAALGLVEYQRGGPYRITEAGIKLLEEFRAVFCNADDNS